MRVFLLLFFVLFISFRYDFHINAEKMKVSMREMSRNICVNGLKKSDLRHVNYS